MSQANLSMRLIYISILITSFVMVFLGFRIYSVVTISEDDMFAHNYHSIGIITSDNIHDQSWGSLAFEGKLLIEDKFPVKVDLISERENEQQKKAATQQLIDEEKSLIIGHGREFSPIFTEFAPNHPEIHFVTLNGESTYSNQSVISSHPLSHMYMVGMISSYMTKTNKIGIIHPNETTGEIGFKMSIAEHNPNAIIYNRVVEARDAEKEAAILAKEMIEAGVDVIFTCGNAYNRAVISEAKAADVYVIGYIDDQSYMAKDHVITSLIIDIPKKYENIVTQFLSENGIPSGNIVYDFKDDIYRIAPFGQMVPEEVKNNVLDKIAQYNQGKYKIEFPEE
ncbi:BMP family ABC transporter substrate-binding protein [Alkalihalobacterium bogoriense]|uniref:BMP family ABC transporter substrate-binding protein n=1 Tax=Alkalihalobacterium bogoriense TaxID=246272 RepID=UPI0006886A36|nr:BMP family ABC transporter substrate-binding protein [Alkalihalobacterium bogoriense]